MFEDSLEQPEFVVPIAVVTEIRRHDHKPMKQILMKKRTLSFFEYEDFDYEELNDYEDKNLIAEIVFATKPSFIMAPYDSPECDSEIGNAYLVSYSNDVFCNDSLVGARRYSKLSNGDLIRFPNNNSYFLFVHCQPLLYYLDPFSLRPDEAPLPLGYFGEPGVTAYLSKVTPRATSELPPLSSLLALPLLYLVLTAFAREGLLDDYLIDSCFDYVRKENGDKDVASAVDQFHNTYTKNFQEAFDCLGQDIMNLAVKHIETLPSHHPYQIALELRSLFMEFDHLNREFFSSELETSSISSSLLQEQILSLSSLHHSLLLEHEQLSEQSKNLQSQQQQNLEPCNTNNEFELTTASSSILERVLALESSLVLFDLPLSDNFEISAFQSDGVIGCGDLSSNEFMKLSDIISDQSSEKFEAQSESNLVKDAGPSTQVSSSLLPSFQDQDQHTQAQEVITQIDTSLQTSKINYEIQTPILFDELNSQSKQSTPFNFSYLSPSDSQILSQILFQILFQQQNQKPFSLKQQQFLQQFNAKFKTSSLPFNFSNPSNFEIMPRWLLPPHHKMKVNYLRSVSIVTPFAVSPWVLPPSGKMKSPFLANEWMLPPLGKIKVPLHDQTDWLFPAPGKIKPSSSYLHNLSLSTETKCFSPSVRSSVYVFDVG